MTKAAAKMGNAVSRPGVPRRHQPPSAALTTSRGFSPQLCKKASGRWLSLRLVPCTDPAGHGLATWYITMLVDQRHGGREKHEGMRLPRCQAPWHHGAKTTSHQSPNTQPLKFSLSTGRQDWMVRKERKGKVLLEEEKFLCTVKSSKLLIAYRGFKGNTALSPPCHPFCLITSHPEVQAGGKHRLAPLKEPSTAPIPACSKIRAVSTKH